MTKFILLHLPVFRPHVQFWLQSWTCMWREVQLRLALKHIYVSTAVACAKTHLRFLTRNLFTVWIQHTITCKLQGKPIRFWNCQMVAESEVKTHGFVLSHSITRYGNWLSFTMLFELVLGVTRPFLSKFHRRCSVLVQSVVKERGCEGSLTLDASWSWI
jgi:hypothetical protein